VLWKKIHGSVLIGIAVNFCRWIPNHFSFKGFDFLFDAVGNGFRLFFVTAYKKQKEDKGNPQLSESHQSYTFLTT
jgi:hypothetical protein